MPLDSLSNSIVKIQPAKWSDIIRNLVAAKANKKRLDAEARAADSQVKSLQSQLFPAFSGAPSAVCGHHLLTITQAAAAPPALTLNTGEKVMWPNVDYVMIGKRKIMREEIAMLFGGRVPGPSIELSTV